MTDPLQSLVNELAQRLERSVVVDDAGLRLVASSSHFEEADPARISSLVDRVVAGEAREYLLRAGIMSWQGVHRTTPEPSAGSVHARVCFPLRSRYELLGFMTIVEDEPLADDEMAAAESTAHELVAIMAGRARAIAEFDLKSEARLLFLLSAARADRGQAAQDLVELGLFRNARYYCAVVVSVPRDWPASDDGRAVDLVRRSLLYSAKGLASRSYAYAVSDSEACLAIGHRVSPSSDDLLRLANIVHRELQRSSPSLAEVAAVGVGLPHEQLENLGVSFDQAVSAVRVGRAAHTAVTAWGDTPMENLLSTLLVPEYSPDLLPKILHLLEDEPAETLLMLETFLDHAGNVVETAERLHLHRTTIYYRLKRIQRISGLDLADGQARLMLHLWLKSKAYSTPV